jgi:ketosteroid isomerase-like protein
MIRRRSLVAWLLLAVAPLARAGPAGAWETGEPLPPGPEGEVLRAEERRLAAVVGADAAALQEILDDELRFTHSTGQVDTKYVYIASLESGRLDYLEARARDVTARVYGDAGVLTGTTVLRLRVGGGEPQKAKLLYTAVYAKRDGAWRLVAYQSTRQPEP